MTDAAKVERQRIGAKIHRHMEIALGDESDERILEIIGDMAIKDPNGIEAKLLACNLEQDEKAAVGRFMVMAAKQLLTKLFDGRTI